MDRPTEARGALAQEVSGPAALSKIRQFEPKLITCEGSAGGNPRAKQETPLKSNHRPQMRSLETFVPPFDAESHAVSRRNETHLKNGNVLDDERNIGTHLMVARKETGATSTQHSNIEAPPGPTHPREPSILQQAKRLIGSVYVGPGAGELGGWGGKEMRVWFKSEAGRGLFGVPWVDCGVLMLDHDFLNHSPFPLPPSLRAQCCMFSCLPLGWCRSRPLV